ncbi:MAG TPA: hypothetical protein VEK36_00825 [Candidatus Paceibacterota bacterium]|nr:hypothetical protein [Candidatus Paceibacterota bacterium]
MKKYEYNLNVKEVIPATEMYQYAARVSFLDRVDSETPEKILHNFGEARGKTRGEAIEKMRIRVEGWISDNK